MVTPSSAAARRTAQANDFKLPYFWRAFMAIGGVLVLIFGLIKNPLEIIKLFRGEPKAENLELKLQKRARVLRQQVDELTGVGCQKGDCASGYGTFIYIDGSIYEGEFRNSQPGGMGLMVFPTGHTREIAFYYGAFLLGQPCGKGFIQYADGSQYEGEVNGWQRHGNGAFSDTVTHEWHKGTWEKDKIVSE